MSQESEFTAVNKKKKKVSLEKTILSHSVCVYLTFGMVDGG